MKRVILFTVLVLSCVGALAAVGPSTQPATQPARRPWSHYEVVVDRNIFMRQRGTGGSGSRRTGGAGSESGGTWALSGTALMANDRVAFLENTRTGTTIRVHEGDNTDAGQVVRIDSDHFELNADGRVVSVPIGSTLDGKPHDLTATTQPTTEPDDTTAAAEPLAPPISSTEAAMRARREQELSHH